LVVAQAQAPVQVQVQAQVQAYSVAALRPLGVEWPLHSTSRCRRRSRQ
jgi:hypothetical protein